MEKLSPLHPDSIAANPRALARFTFFRFGGAARLEGGMAKSLKRWGRTLEFTTPAPAPTGRGRRFELSAQGERYVRQHCDRVPVVRMAETLGVPYGNLRRWMTNHDLPTLSALEARRLNY